MKIVMKVGSNTLASFSYLNDLSIKSGSKIIKIRCNESGSKAGAIFK